MRILFNTIAASALALAMVSCADTDTYSDIGNVSNEAPSAKVAVTEEGYLRFESQQIFDEFYNEAKASLTSNAESRAGACLRISVPGFTSINDINSKSNNQIGSRTSSGTINELIEEDDLDCEVGTEEECRLSIVNELIPDEALQCLLDTTLRIEISDTYYRITCNGTLYAKIEYKEKVDSIAEISGEVSKSPVATNIYETDSDVYIADTYGRIIEEEEIEATDWTDLIDALNPQNRPNIPPTTTSPPTPTYQNNSYYWGNVEENTSYYSLINRQWDAKTILGDILEWVSGCKYIKEDNKFDKNHRVQCKLYNLDFAFVNSAGFRVEMEKRKKFLFIPYWVSCGGAEDLVIGFEDFQGEVSIDHPISIANPVAYYTSNFNGAVNNMVYAGLCKPTFIEDWINISLPCLFHGAITDNLIEWGLNPSKYTEHLTKNVIDTGVNSLFGKTLDGMKSALKKGDPILNINPYAEDKHEFWIYGINGWKNTNSKSIKFGESYGFTYPNIWSGWTPEEYKILRPQMFGAIKYNGQWRGVRFTE